MAAKTKVSKADRLAAIRERLENTNVGGQQQGWFNPKEGVNKIRILPEVGDMEIGNFFQEVGAHYLPDGKGKSKRVYCPNFTSGGDLECPICEVVDELYRSGDKDNKKLAGELRVRKSYWMNVIDRNNEAAGPLVFSCGVTIMRALIAAISDPDYGDISDIYDGLDVTIEKSGTGMDTEYQVRFARLATPLAGTSKSPDEDQIDKWLDAAKDLTWVELTDNPDEDKDTKDGKIVWVLPYDRMLREHNLDVLMDADEDDEEEVEEEEVKEVHPAKREVSERRARRQR